jgi:hypothetical protein
MEDNDRLTLRFLSVSQVASLPRIPYRLRKIYGHARPWEFRNIVRGLLARRVTFALLFQNRLLAEPLMTMVLLIYKRPGIALQTTNVRGEEMRCGQI